MLTFLAMQQHIFEDAFREGDHPCVPDVLALIEHVGGKGLTIRGFRKYLALLKESPNTSNTALSFNLLKTLVAIGNNDGASYVAVCRVFFLLCTELSLILSHHGSFNGILSCRRFSYTA